MAKKNNTETVTLHGLYKRRSSRLNAGAKAGEVSYNKRGNFFNIMVPYTCVFDKTRKMRDAGFASFDVEADLIKDIKRLARPFSTIDDSVDNRREKLARIRVTVDIDGGIITGHTVADEVTEEELAQRTNILEANTNYALFLQAPTLGK